MQRNKNIEKSCVMTRKKVKLQYIANNSSRKNTFKKRIKGLIKKVNELSTLCGIKACAIVYGPFTSTAEVWPSDSGVRSLIAEFRTLPDIDQQKKMLDQEAYLEQMVVKAEEKLKKQRKANRKEEMNEVLIQCLEGNMSIPSSNLWDLNDLGYLIDQYHNDVDRRIKIIKKYGTETRESSDVVAPLEGTGSMTSAFFNPFHEEHQYQQHQFLPPATSHIGFYDQLLIHNQNYSQEMMNHPQLMSYAAGQIRLPFMVDSQHHHQNQHIPGYSSTTPAADSSSTISPVTSSNFTNNILFR